jgi:tetratricopeptide (TPR) repeat protein
MEVRDVFAMRKEGRWEEAYRAIMQLYAVHQGPHTNLCMFWCTNDLFKLRAKQKRTEEARRLLFQLVKLYPQTKDRIGQGNRAIINAALTMDKLTEGFNLLYFMPYYNRMTEADWQPYIVNGHRVPSLGQQVVNHLLKDISKRDANYINQIADLFSTAFKKAPYYKENLRHLAQMHSLVGHTDKAIDTYKQILLRHHDSYLYAELAKLLPDNTEKIALYCQAIVHQYRDEYAAKYHLELAWLMYATMPRRAAYELARYMEIKQRKGQHVAPSALKLQQRLGQVSPVTSDEEQVLYERSAAAVEKILH